MLILSIVLLILCLAFMYEALGKYRYFSGLVEKDWVLLELKISKAITKTPQAMEIVLSLFYQPYTWFSLEMISIGGEVHFFVRCERKFKGLVESQFYSQYGDVEIYEVDDYATKIDYDGGETVDLWGATMALTNADPYPIKTYVDYGQDKEGLRDEHQVDPMAPTIEYLSSLGSGEQAWIQILVTKTIDRYPKKSEHWWQWEEKQNWKDEGRALIDEMMGRDKKPKEGEIDVGQLKKSPGETDVMKAIERSISKIGFDVGIRIIYLSKKDNFSKERQAGLANVFNQYNTLNLNGFKVDLTKATGATYVIQDKIFRTFGGKYKWKGREVRFKKKLMIDAYRHRAYFNFPYKMTPFVLNSEELATIFHMPGGVVTTGSIARVASKKAEPPTNLPV